MSANTNASSRLHGLDTLRAAAILWVMPFHLLGHFPEVLQEPSRFGWMGVDLFFVLSGFLIGTQLFRPCLAGKRVSIREFYARRAYRILPAFFAVLLLYMFVPAWREAPGLQAWWQFATFSENLVIDYSRNQAFSHAWSLCVEEHFYLLLPLLTVALMRRPAAWKTYALLAAVLVAGVAVRGYVLVHSLRPLEPDTPPFYIRYIEAMYYPTYVRLDGLLAGVSLALLRTFRPAWWEAMRRRGHLLTVCGVAVLAFTVWCTMTRMSSVTGRAFAGDLFGYPLLALSFALLTASALSSNGVLARVGVPGAKWISSLAFALYLTHKATVHLLFLCFPGLPDQTWRMLPMLFAACVLVAAALHFAVERPFLVLRESRANHRIDVPALELQARIDPAL